jgi:hypothetical protein
MWLALGSDASLVVGCHSEGRNKVRAQTMKRHTIINTFKVSGIWPHSAAKGLQKLRSYHMPKREIGMTLQDDSEDDLQLPKLPPTQPEEAWDTTTKLRALGNRDPTQFSEHSIGVYHQVLRNTDVLLQKAHLQSVQLTNLQQSIQEQERHKVKSRKSSHKGGAAVKVEELRARIATKERREATEAL